MTNILNEIPALKLRCYRFNELKKCFYKEYKCESGNDESHDLIKIATFLNEENIAYIVDKNYEINLYFDDSEDAFIVKLDKDANILDFNAYASLLTGYSQESVKGQNWFKVFIDQDDMSNILEVFQGVLEDNLYHWSHTNKIRCKDGSFKEITWRNSLTKDKFGDLDVVLSIGVNNK